MALSSSTTKSKFKQLLFSKPIIIILIIFIIFIGTLEFQQLRKRSIYNQEITKLQQQEKDLVAKNQTLQNSLQYFNNDQYKEKIARQQLNLRKDGEIVVNFPPSTNLSTQPQPTEPQLSNPQKWWNYFFNRTN